MQKKTNKQTNKQKQKQMGVIFVQFVDFFVNFDMFTFHSLRKCYEQSGINIFR